MVKQGLPEAPKKERYKDDKTNARYATIDAQRKTATEELLILMKLPITNICSVRIGCFISSEKYLCDETKLRAQWRSEARTQESHKQGHDEPAYWEDSL